MVQVKAGFSLIEILVVMSIFSGMLYLSLPYLQTYNVKAQIDAELIKMTSLFKQSKQYSVSRRQSIVVCPVKNAELELSDLRCGDNWQSSIMAFYDPDGDFEMNTQDELVHIVEPSLVKRVVNRTKFKISPLLNASTTAGRITICPKHSNKRLDKQAKSIVVSNVGRVREQSGFKQCQ